MLDKQQHEGRTRSQPASAYAEALVAWDSGDHDTTLSILEVLPTSRQTIESLLLCARAFIRKDRLCDARRWLARSVGSHRTPNNHATHLMLQAMILAREEGYVAKAELLFARALELKAHYTIAAEIRFEKALAQYSAQRYDDARATLQEIRRYSGVVYVRAIALEGWLDSVAGDYPSAQAAFGNALTALDESKAVDMHLRASLVYAYSLMVAECDHSHADRLIREAERVSWGHSLVREQVQTFRNIGILHRRAGRSDDAMRRFAEAAGVQPGSPWQIIGLAECACLCVDLDNRVGARGYVVLAQCLVDQIEWTTVLGEQRLALLVLAQAFARLGDGVAAKTLTERFDPASHSITRPNDSHREDRLGMYVQHTMGLVDAACGDIATARESLSAAHRAWSRIGYRSRALEALDDIQRIDPRRTPNRILERASNMHRQLIVDPECGARRPVSHMNAAALRECFTRRYNISPRMADILQLVVRGHGNGQIASELGGGLAERTIKNKVNELYKIVGIENGGATKRAQLVARCIADSTPATTNSIGYPDTSVDSRQNEPASIRRSSG